MAGLIREGGFVDRLFDGGSSSAPAGAVDYPPEIKDLYTTLMHGTTSGGTPIDVDASGNVPTWVSLMSEMQALIAAGAPQAALTAINPATELTKMTDEFALMQAFGNQLDTVTTYEELVDVAAQAVESYLEAPPDIAGMIDTSEIKASFERAQKPQLMRAINRFTAGMAEVNSVHSSAFLVGLANLETEAMANVDSFSRQLDLQVDQTNRQIEGQIAASGDRNRLKIAGIESAMNMMLQLKSLEFGTNQFRSQMQFELSRADVVAKSQEQQDQLNLDLADDRWNTDIMMQAVSTIGVIGGTTVVPGKLTPLQHAFSQLGPGIGLAVAVAGAGAGGLGIAAAALVPIILGTVANTRGF